MKKILLSIAVCVVCTFFCSVAAFAVQLPPSGSWEHGVWGGGVHSNFYHPSKVHGSSCNNGLGVKDKKEHIAGGYTSYTGVWSTPMGNEEFWSWG